MPRDDRERGCLVSDEVNRSLLPSLASNTCRACSRLVVPHDQVMNDRLTSSKQVTPEVKQGVSSKLVVRSPS